MISATIKQLRSLDGVQKLVTNENIIKPEVCELGNEEENYVSCTNSSFKELRSKKKTIENIEKFKLLPNRRVSKMNNCLNMPSNANNSLNNNTNNNNNNNNNNGNNISNINNNTNYNHVVTLNKQNSSVSGLHQKEVANWENDFERMHMYIQYFPHNNADIILKNYEAYMIKKLNRLARLKQMKKRRTMLGSMSPRRFQSKFHKNPDDKKSVNFIASPEVQSPVMNQNNKFDNIDSLWTLEEKKL